MYRKILVGHDLEDGGRDAIALGRTLADATGADLVAAGVFHYPPLVQQVQAEREERLRVTAEVARDAEPVGAQTKAYASSSPARGLHDLAEEMGADLVVVGSSGEGRIAQAVAGSVGLSLLHGAPCAVAIAPRGYRDHAPRRLSALTVAIDGSAEAKLALHAAVALAAAGDISIKLVAVAEPPVLPFGAYSWGQLKAANVEERRGQLERALAELPRGVQHYETSLPYGDPAEQLAEVAAVEGGILMLGSRAYGPVRRVLLGSVSSQLVRSAPCPVVVHPRGSGTQASDDAA